MASNQGNGGIIHTYQRYDPVRLPGPNSPPPDLVTPAMEHMLLYGSRRELTPEELARAIEIDPSQIAGLGPSLDALLAMLRERKRKILARYETERVQQEVSEQFRKQASASEPPRDLRKVFHKIVRQEQIRDLERLWYAAERNHPEFARRLVQLLESLGEKYEVDQLAAKYEFTGREPMSIPQALAINEELEKIDELIKQLEEASRTAQIGLIDLDSLAEFAEPGDVAGLSAMQQQIQDMLEEMARQQGLDQSKGAFQLTPHAYRLFQGKLLERLFSDLSASKTGRHQGEIEGEGSTEIERTKDYEFGDSVAHLDIPATFVNALIRRGPGLPISIQQDDMVIHRTRNTPKSATAVLMDMSGSMRYDAQYVNVKRMALALEGLISSEFPGDWLGMVEIYSLAKQVERGRVVELMPKPVTIHDPIVRLSADLSRDDISEYQIPPHFTNIQHGLSQARRLLSVQDTPNRQVILITDGLPTAHFEGSTLYLLYPPDPRTEEATMREARLCQREGITINIFLLPSWSQSEEDVRFAYRLAETTAGRVFFTAGSDLDRYVVWDYVERKREILS